MDLWNVLKYFKDPFFENNENFPEHFEFHDLLLKT